ncbi:hypothetical protein GE061_004889 [Apolygus lucorum]|uniref:Uncharacterized protein n=1 Tax=Apolygus lucorum TaxID=248454 RepID=A0A8S9WXC0_APOLU|nr:hypothetical protein GE061_004889 [Apolygus lucorum]
MSRFSALIRYSLYTVAGGAGLYAFISPSSDIPAKDPMRDDSQRFLVLQHMKKAAESSQSSYNKPLEIKTVSDK